MISLLAKLFIKNRNDVENPVVRQAYGMLCGLVGIGLNLVLFVSKYVAGTLACSIAITADAMNNLSDAGSSVITLVGFKLAGKRNDAQHPFGHGRIEYIAGLLVSMIILLMGLELAKSSVEKILRPEAVAFHALSVWIMVGSVLVKLYMALYNRRISRKINSVAMAATAADSLSDAVATTAVLVSLIVAKMTGIQIDGWAGGVVSAMILWTGWKTMRDTLSPLLGSAPDPALIHRIEDIVGQYEQICGMHDLIIHDYGPGRMMISLHAEVPVDGNIMELHDVVDTVEMRLRDELHCHAVIHMDPVATDDERVNAMREQLSAALREKLDPHIRIHDFRMVEGPTHTNLVFDAVIPDSFQEDDAEIRRKICQIVRELDGNYYGVVTLDRGYIGEK